MKAVLNALRARASWLMACALIAGCASPIDTRPVNEAISRAPGAVPLAARQDIVGEHVIGLAFSGGGLRASAFAFGVLQALNERPSGAPAVLNDIGFITAVSGGSITAAYYGLNGPDMLQSFREAVLLQDMERGMNLSAASPSNLLRLLSGGLNDRSNLALWLDREVFRGATFADLYRRKKPDIWINASDVFNRTPFVFTPSAFAALCSDLGKLPVAEAVHASMAVPLVFAPVVLQTFPAQCDEALPGWVARVEDDPASGLGVKAVAQAVRHYRDPARQRYVKLVDGGVTDNYGLSSIVVGRAIGGSLHAPMTAADAVRVRRMLFIVVDAGRSPSADWVMEAAGPSAVDMAIAATDSAIDSATRVGFEVFRSMLRTWEDDVRRYRCGLTTSELARLQGPAAGGKSTVWPTTTAQASGWDCRDVRFDLELISFADLGPERAARLNQIPTRLTLPAVDIDDAVQAGFDAALGNATLQRFRLERARTRGPFISQ